MRKFGVPGANMVQAMSLGNRELDPPEPHAQAYMLHAQELQTFLWTPDLRQHETT
jgi:hypothetical protein